MSITNKIKQNDPLREKKIAILARIEEIFKKDLRKDTLVWLQDKVIEKYIPIIIQEVFFGYDKGVDLIEEIINMSSESEKEIENIEVEINKALEANGGAFGYELNNMYYNEFRHALTGVIVIDSYKRKGKEDELLEMLKNDLVKFDEKATNMPHYNYELFKKTAISMLRDNLLANIKDCEARIEKSQGDSEQKKDKKISQEGNKVRDILGSLQNCEFWWSPHSSSVMVNTGIFVLNKKKHVCRTVALETLRGKLEQEINNLNDELLPTEQKKAELLKKLAAFVENGKKEAKNTQPSNSTVNNETNETSDDASDDYSEVSSIFDEHEETDNSSVGSADNDDDEQKLDSQKEDPKLIEQWREQNIRTITKFLNKEPVVKEADLEAENHNWLEQIKASDSWTKINNISQRVWGDITRKRKIKKQNLDLDAILEGTVDARNFDNHFQTIQRSLGETELQVKTERAKKKLIENDPELYFDTFNNWIKEEEKALELEAKNKELEAISELEYSEEEKQFLAGQITDQQKQEAIAQQIEVKINVKKKYWNIIKWIKAQTEWLKTKAKLLRKNNKVGFEKEAKQIKQEIKNAENNSNLHARQAFKHAKNKVESLLRELENISNENTNNTADKNKFPTGLVVGIGVILLTTALITTLIIRWRKKKFSK